ncbi:MAG: hypothetical protein HC927_10635, partial [Deltaproteobacteria bacterium]|nr:hypothetical protein [Deltaproteobacteria bacterium]
ARSFTANIQEAYRSIPPGGFRDYRIAGLQRAVESDLPLTFRFKPDSGGNRPDVFYTVAFWFPLTNDPPQIRESALGAFQSIPVPVSAINLAARRDRSRPVSAWLVARPTS